ncbi:MAG TPA: hypothetical protein VMC09_12095 [Anaerolineales bacterium]|nr:hypothetical protein [Anaerolineales bacterium]
MSDRVDEQTLADRLAADTDRLLAGEEIAEKATPGAEASALFNTVERLSRLLPSREPDADLRNRIRGRLAAEWNKTGPGARQEAAGWSRLAGKRNPLFVWAGAGLVILLVIGILITPAIVPDQTGAAQFQVGALAVGIVVLGIIALIFWWLRRK